MVPIKEEQRKVQEDIERRFKWKKLKFLRYTKGIQVRPGEYRVLIVKFPRASLHMPSDTSISPERGGCANASAGKLMGLCVDRDRFVAHLLRITDAVPLLLRSASVSASNVAQKTEECTNWPTCSSADSITHAFGFCSLCS